ncbi:MAG: protein kinase [Planctomycetes bacterium]|nr:protein kinase [Planctomycetota bacterium]
MSTTTDEGGPFADLVDELLGELLDGATPDLEAMAQRHPAVAARVPEALSLASSLAGRKVSPRPTLAGYEIQRELGRGGMGTVYLARQVALDRQVAIKVLPNAFGLSQDSRRRFLEEARALARLEHEHIVQIYRVLDDGELLAFEMEYIDGPSLHTLLAALREHRERTGQAPGLAEISAAINVPVAQLGARNPTQFFVRLLLKVARALGAVHAKGFVHRDVKPANVLLRKNGDPVVVDFGLVRSHGIEATHAGRFAGTPVYSSPEQLRGEVVIGPPADVYSLGVTLYECLTLVTPFSGRTTTALLQRIEAGRFRPLRRLQPSAPRDLETIVAHAMEVSPLERYADAGQLADDLQRLLELHPIQARPAGPLKRVDRFFRRNRNPLFAACLGALLVAALAIPLLHNVEAHSLALEQAARHLTLARQHVVELDSGSLEWQHNVWGGGTRPLLRAAAAQSAPLRAAAAEYERALALAPEDTQVRGEHAVTRLALWLQNLTVARADAVANALDGEQFATMTAALGPATVQAARQFAGAPDALAPATIDDATAADCTTLGLLAYMVGDSRLCERAWSKTTPPHAQALVDAGLGRLLLADGMLEPAYARLLQAHRDFPDSAALTLALAEAALQLGEVGATRTWLARAPADAALLSTRRRIELDLRAATGADAKLRDDYQRLADEEPTDPTPRYRLAQLALRHGDVAAATRMLDELLRGWPEAAQFRLDRARLALQQRDLAAYAQQVMAVLAADFGRGRSRGTVADLLEILRIGGLDELHAAGIEATGGDSAGRALFGGELPIRAFAPLAMTRNFEALCRTLDAVARTHRHLTPIDDLLDPTGGRLLRWAPIALDAVGVAAHVPTAAQVVVRLTPWVGPALYGMVMPLLHRLYISSEVSEWRPLPLQRLTLPTGLDAALVTGKTMLSVPDCTGDGRRDLLVSWTVDGPQLATGCVAVYDGATDELLATLRSSSDEHMFGHALAAVDDVDGDGIADWLIGCPASTQTVATAHVELWSSGTRKRLHTVTSDEQAFGAALTGLGDCDGDGVADFAVAAPPPALQPAMAFHPALNKIIMFGGETTSGVGLDETWTWDGADWQQINLVGPRPPARSGATLLQILNRGIVVLFGGRDPVTFEILNDTWEHDGVQWRKVDNVYGGVYPPRTDAAVAHDIMRDRIVLFGGKIANQGLRNDTWEYGAQWQPFGMGCAGSAGTPQFTGVDVPRLATTTSARIDNVPPAMPLAFVAMGLSRTQWALGSLPYLLTPLGMPNCRLYTSADLIVTVPANAGVATWTWDVPNDQSLVGAALYLQGVTFDPGINAFSLAVANAATMVVGN